MEWPNQSQIQDEWEISGFVHREFYLPCYQNLNNKVHMMDIKPDIYQNFEPTVLAYYSATMTGDHGKLVSWDFHVLYLVNKDDHYTYVHCLDLDIMAYARDESAAEIRLMDMIVGHIEDHTEEGRLEFLMANPVDSHIMDYYHKLKRDCYSEVGKKLDKYFKDKTQYSTKPRRKLNQSIQLEHILVEKVEQWILEAA